jgi:hypothetical protein
MGNDGEPSIGDQRQLKLSEQLRMLNDRKLSVRYSAISVVSKA